MERKKGFILRSYEPRRQAIALLDEYCGRLECKVVSPKTLQMLSHGMLIEYILYQQRIPRIELLDILAVPFALACIDIGFLHTVLELSYFFVPVGSQAESVFHLLQILVVHPELFKNEQKKKLFFFKFFEGIGVHPEGIMNEYRALEQLRLQPLDVIFNNVIQVPEKALDCWLEACIATHPYCGQFKTLVAG